MSPLNQFNEYLKTLMNSLSKIYVTSIYIKKLTGVCAKMSVWKNTSARKYAVMLIK
jgi:hypothetical protein